MADNLSKAYEIYRFIQDMQIEQIKNKTIKPEDVIKISKDDFIKELQDTVNFYTKGTTNKRIIDDVYSNISTMIKKVSSIDEIISGKDIRIPAEVIAKSVDMAVQKNELNAVNIKEEIKDTQTAILITQFETLKSPEEKIKFFESRSSKEQEEIAQSVFENAYGDIGKKFAKYVKKYFDFENEMKNDSWTDADIKDFKEMNGKIFELMDEFRETYEFPKNVNISFSEMVVFVQSIGKIQNKGLDLDVIIESNFSLFRKIYGPNVDKDFLKDVLKRSLSEKAKTLIKEEETKDVKVSKIISENKKYLEGFLSGVLPKEVVEGLNGIEISEIFLKAINENGDFSPIAFVANLRALQQKKPKDDPFWGDEEQFNSSLDNIRSNKNKLQESFEQGFGALKKNEATTLDGSNPQKPNASERDPKPVQEPVAPEVAEAASFFTFTANDMMSFAAFTPSIGMEQDGSDFMTSFASFAQIPDASVTPVYEASTDEIQVDPAIHGMVDEERPTPPVTEENETDVRGSGAEGTTPPDIVTEETELDGDEDRDSPKDQETEENEKTQNTYGKDSFPGLIKAAEITINDMRATQNELNPKDQNRINETNELDDDKDTK